jgi:hypothetical protein
MRHDTEHAASGAAGVRSRSLSSLLVTISISSSKTHTKSVEGDILMLPDHLSSPENSSLAGNFTSIAAATPEDYVAKIEFLLGFLAHKSKDLFVRDKLVGLPI